MKIVDPASGALLPRGQAGELCTRGYSVMLGYWNNDEATAKAIDRAGWMHTDYARTGLPFDAAAVRIDRLVEAVDRLRRHFAR